MDFRNKVVLITGAAQGIGAACRKAFTDRGAHVSVLDLRGPEAETGTLCWTTGDVTAPEIRKLAFSRTLDRYGHIDILVNNVGIGLYSNPSETSPDLVQRLFDVNVSAAVGLCNLVVPHMRSRRQGSIVNIESIGALVSLPWCSMYCASKFALRAFSRSLRHEVRREGIHVLSVLPGIVDTKFREHVLSGEAPSGVQNLKRVVSRESIAQAVLSGLASRKTNVITPKIGIPFYAMELLAPRIMDWYIQRCWDRGEQPLSGIPSPERVRLSS